MADVLRAAKRATKAAKASMISSLCNQLDKERKTNNGNIPYGAMKKLLLRAKEISPHYQITRFDISNHQRKIKRKNEAIVATTPIEEEETALGVHDQNQSSSFRALGGRPKGATKESRHICQASIVAARNEIATTYAGEKRKAASQNKRIKKGRLDEIIKRVKTKHNLPTDFIVSPKTIRNHQG